MKTNKSFSKRIKVTKSGKIIVRKPGLNHFNAKASRNSKMNKKRSALFVMTNKSRARFLSNM
ncbi:50S ribosomal protein L35 [Patescibacteria group bacterium]|nr:50S ribosomal protein L35 [Patescibacteria group bacterium]MBU4115754.1 50S ribosomal protein L35 [Patescibacteria group bacterium]